MSEQSLILSNPSPTGVLEFSFGAVALAEKESALTKAALIGIVRTPEENAAAVDAQKEIKRVALAFERERKKLKEPLIEAGRRLDRVVQTEIVELDKELGRLSNLTTEFQLAEQRRIREEQEAQARELARIEAEKQAELKRIADEQARVEREAREAREARQSSRASAVSLPPKHPPEPAQRGTVPMKRRDRPQAPARREPPRPSERRTEESLGRPR